MLLEDYAIKKMDETLYKSDQKKIVFDYYNKIQYELYNEYVKNHNVHVVFPYILQGCGAMVYDHNQV